MTLPSGYTQLEYIESTGTQYIDTGITPHLANDTQVYTDLAPSQSSYSSKGFGSNNNLNIYIASDTTHWRVNGKQSTISIVQNKKTSFHLYFYADGKRGASIDGVEINKGSVNEANYNFLLGACGGVASASGFAAKWYGCKIYQNNVVTIDLVPAKRKSDGVVGMYDLVTDTFYTNAGTGTFIAGPEVIISKVIIHGNVGTKKAIAPYSPYEWLEYIESSGTQYIDTGVNGTSVTRFYIKGECVENSGNNCQLLGGTQSGATTFYGVRVVGAAVSWYPMDSNGTSILSGHNLMSADITINSTTSQTGYIKDELNGIQYNNVAKLGSSSWGFYNENLLIFGGYTSRITKSGKIYKLILYTSEGIVRDLVPARRKSDGVVGMYDKVNDVFYTNSGTGNFIAGPVKAEYMD